MQDMQSLAAPRRHRPGSACQLFICKARRAVGGVAQAAALVFFIHAEIAFEPFDVAVAFERQNMGRQAIEEEAVMADDHGAAREIFDRFFERRQRFDVEVVGRFVEQENVAALFQHLGDVDAVAFTA